jgi:hypothetical protein
MTENLHVETLRTATFQNSAKMRLNLQSNHLPSLASPTISLMKSPESKLSKNNILQYTLRSEQDDGPPSPQSGMLKRKNSGNANSRNMRAQQNSTDAIQCDRSSSSEAREGSKGSCGEDDSSAASTKKTKLKYSSFSKNPEDIVEGEQVENNNNFVVDDDNDKNNNNYIRNRSRKSSFSDKLYERVNNYLEKADLWVCNPQLIHENKHGKKMALYKLHSHCVSTTTTTDNFGSMRNIEKPEDTESVMTPNQIRMTKSEHTPGTTDGTKLASVGRSSLLQRRERNQTCKPVYNGIPITPFVQKPYNTTITNIVSMEDMPVRDQDDHHMSYFSMDNLPQTKSVSPVLVKMHSGFNFNQRDEQEFSLTLQDVKNLALKQLARNESTPN